MPDEERVLRPLSQGPDDVAPDGLVLLDLLLGELVVDCHSFLFLLPLAPVEEAIEFVVDVVAHPDEVLPGDVNEREVCLVIVEVLGDLGLVGLLQIEHHRPLLPQVVGDLGGVLLVARLELGDRRLDLADRVLDPPRGDADDRRDDRLEDEHRNSSAIHGGPLLYCPGAGVGVWASWMPSSSSPERVR